MKHFLALAACLPGCALGHRSGPSRPSSTSAQVYDVAVIGAGLSGLAAACTLQEANKSFIILEARDRVGGRVENFHLENGGVTELGAAFVGPTQDYVLALASELGLEVFPEYNNGSSQLFAGNTTSSYTSAGLTEALGLQAGAEIGNALTLLDTYAASINVTAPWTHPNASLWDAMTLQSWANETFASDTVSLVFGLTIPAIFSAEAGELSFLYTLAYIAAAGNATTPGAFERLISTAGGSQESRIAGGTGLLPEGLAKRIGLDHIKLNTPVRSIEQHSADEYAIWSDNTSFYARAIIVAMSPPLASRIVYDPPLLPARDQLTQRMFMGSLGKATAIYSTPFWRNASLSGQAVSDTGVVRTTFDVSPEDGSYGAILGFIEADQMRALDTATEGEMQELITKDYVRYFGPLAANVTQWVFKRWDNEVFSRGGPVAVAGPGTLTAYGESLRKPAGRIHWAGTESSDFWVGYMDGALRAGERAAKEIVG